MHELERGLAHGVVKGSPEHLFGQGIGPQHVAGRIQDDHEVGKVREQPTQSGILDCHRPPF